MIWIAEKQTRINKTKVDGQVQSTTFSKEKSNAQAQNRELLARQKHCRREAGLTHTEDQSTTSHYCQKKANLIWVKLNQVLRKMQEETPLEALRQVEEVSFGKAEDIFDPTSAGAGKQQMSGGASQP